MRILRAVISLDLVISFFLLIAFIFLFTTKRTNIPTIASIAAISFLVLNLGFCIYSLTGLYSGKKKLIQKLWVSYFIFIAGFVITDYIAGQTVLKKISPSIRRDARVHHELIPNTTSQVTHMLAYDTNIMANNIGCRGEQISEAKADSTERILMLGDSFTMGKGVNDNETFSALLENMLNKNGGRYEVINCGIDSYSPVLQYLQLKEKIDLINPDLVILNFDMSDLVQEYVYRKSGSFDEDGNIIAVNGIEKETKDPVFKRLRGWIYSNMLTVSIIHQYIYYESYASELMNLENLVARPSTKLLEHTLKIYDDQEFNELFGLVKQSMMEIKKLCETKGCEYIITTYPWGHQVNNWEWVPGRYEFVPKSHEISDRTVIELEKFTQQNDLPFLNTFPDFRSYQGKDPLYYKYDMHWTEAGHEVMALSINNFLDNYINSSEYNK